MAQDPISAGENRPCGAISVMGDAMTAVAMKPRLSIQDQTELLKTP